MSTLDFRPTTDALSGLVRGVGDDQLTARTPCPDYTVADLLDHIGGLSFAFTAAARKERLPESQSAPEVDGSRLEPGWRDQIAERLDALATAWTDPAAYTGETQAGPVDLPAEIAALVALDEVTLHAWDLAVATGQPYDADPAAVTASQSFVDSFEPPPDSPAEDGGLFGRPVAVPPDASALDRLLGAAGRDPAWRP